jgi:hypothetical protein
MRLSSRTFALYALATFISVGLLYLAMEITRRAIVAIFDLGPKLNQFYNVTRIR